MWGEVAMPSASRDKYAMCQLVTVVLQTHDFGVGRTWPRFFLSRGPCDKVAYMTAMTVRGKKKNRASAEGDVECHAQTTHVICMRVPFKYMR